jgi:outer membrane protein insertion porin family
MRRLTHVAIAALLMAWAGDAAVAAAQAPVTPAVPVAPAAAVASANDAASIEQMLGRRVAGVRIERLGQAVSDARLEGLIETKAGAPLSMREVRDSLLHLYNTGLFEAVNVSAEAGPGTGGDASAITVVYHLTPARTVTRYEFRGELGLDESDLRRLLVDRHGVRPALGRAQAAVETLQAHYKEAGYLNARVSSAIESITAENVALVMNVTSGARARIGRIDIRGQIDPGKPAESTPERIQARLGIAPGQPFDGPELQRRIARIVQDLRNRGHYEAALTPTQTPSEDGQVIDLAIEIEPGPLVTVRVEGSTIPTSRQEELIPVRREGSIDEDLLEDSKRRIESYLYGRGHWRADVSYARRPTPAGLDLVFTIREGAVFRIADVKVTGEKAMSLTDIHSVLGLITGAPFVESEVDARTAALVERYRRQGFRGIKIEQTLAERDTPPASVSANRGNRANRETRDDKQTAWVDVSLAIAEGPQARVGSIAIRGNTAVDEAALRAVLTLKPEGPFYEPQIAGDREAIQAVYLNRGFERVQVDVTTVNTPDGARADLTYTIREGSQLFVDRILIVGNRRTDIATIEKALTIKTGEPLGLSALFESQRRLSALGLFRRVRITDVGEPGESGRDVIVTVDEAPATMIGYGAGLEAGRRAGAADDGTATEKVDFAARGFFEVSRRNLFGSNRIATVFTRGSLRPQDNQDTGDTSFGFNEYRVVATLRDPASFGVIDTQVSGYFEQAVRTSFNFRRRGLQAEFARRVRRDFTLVGSYALSHTELFNERISDEDRPDIDRLFPQVRLSVFSGAARRDRRDDILDPTRGTVIGVDTDVAVRALGSEVGFVKGFGEFFWYRQLPGSRAVFATGARLGLAKGFPREVPREIDGVPVIGPDGNALVDRITDLPASERFFAGGDTTVRGYARDTLGDPATISRGFPRGGNALIILNSELRVPVWRDIGSAIFLDVGNVFSRVSEIELSHLRPTAGFGLRYKSPIGPIRVDLGFKLDRGRFDLLPGDREPLWEFHISIGQAF